MSRRKPGYQRPTKVPLDVENRMRDGRGGVGHSSGGYDFSASVKGGGAGATYSVPPPWIAKPRNGVDFQAFGTQPGMTTASGTLVLASAQLPSGRVGVIRSISALANALLTTSDILFSLRYDGVGVSGWTDLTINPRAAGSVEVSWTPDETYIAVPEGALVEFVARVDDAGTYQLSGSFHGWHYGTQLAYMAEQSLP